MIDTKSNPIDNSDNRIVLTKISMDLTKVIYEGKCLLSQSISKVAEILKIDKNVLINSFKAQYPKLSWNEANATIKEIVLSRLEEGDKGNLKNEAEKMRLVLKRGLKIEVESKPDFLDMIPPLDLTTILTELKVLDDQVDNILTEFNKYSLYFNNIFCFLCSNSHNLLNLEQRLKAIQILRREEPSYFKRRDRAGNTQLHFAVDKGHPAILKSLLPYDENPNPIFSRKDCRKKTRNGLTPYHIAMRKGIDMAMILRPFSNPTEQNTDRLTPFHLMAKYRHDFTDAHYRVLFANIAEKDMSLIVDNRGMTPLHLGVINENEGLIDYYKRSEFDMNPTDFGGNPPFFSAVQYNCSLSVCEKLFDISLFNIVNSFKRNVFHYAALLPDGKIFRFLKEKALRLNVLAEAKKKLTEPDLFGITPAMYVRTFGESPCYDAIKEELTIEEMEMTPSTDKLNCPLCQNVFLEPVTTLQGFTCCRSCVLNHEKKFQDTDFEPIPCLKKIIAFYNLRTSTDLPYNELVLRNVDELKANLRSLRLKFVDNEITLAFEDFQIIIDNKFNAEEQMKSRLIVSASLEQFNTKSLASLKTLLRLFSPNQKRFNREGICIKDEKPHLSISLTFQDLLVPTTLNDTVNNVFELLNKLKEKLNELQINNPKKRKVDSAFPPLNEIESVKAMSTHLVFPDDETCFYEISGKFLRLSVLVDHVDVQSPNDLMDYLRIDEEYLFSKPYMEGEKLFRLMTIPVQEGEVIDPEKLKEYANFLKGINSKKKDDSEKMES